MLNRGDAAFDTVKLEAMVETLLECARIPGAALAIVQDGALRFAQGFGLRDRAAGLPATENTLYPIASASKSINALLIAMLVEDGTLAWDVPVADLWPAFRLHDRAISQQVTLRDLVLMRTGLPRHDWAWLHRDLERHELARAAAHLDLSASFRERFQYSNISATLAGHVAEIVCGESWESLVARRIFRPLGMASSSFGAPAVPNVTRAYHENNAREIVPTKQKVHASTAPSGGSIYSTVDEMARWVLFNLNGGMAGGMALIRPDAFADLHRPHIPIGHASLTGLPPAGHYGLGWLIDRYRGNRRVSHGGYHGDVHSSVMLFPDAGIGLVCFTNFGFPAMAEILNQHTFDLMTDPDFTPSFDQKLADYEQRIEQMRARVDGLTRKDNAPPSHPLGDYAGHYVHPGYGWCDIVAEDGTLVLHKEELVLALDHWHHDYWVAKGGPFFLHAPHAFDVTRRMGFWTNEDGYIDALSMRLESTVDPIRFDKASSETANAQ